MIATRNGEPKAAQKQVRLGRMDRVLCVAAIVLTFAASIYNGYVAAKARENVIELKQIQEQQTGAADKEERRLFLVEQARKLEVVREADLLTKQEANIDAARRLNEELKKQRGE